VTNQAIPTNYAEAMVRLKSRVSTMEDRPQQDHAARAIEKAIEDGSILVCQAGTGVGKSNAGLIPAITSGQRVVYATATKVLQSQIVDKDLPFLQEHLGIDFTFASLKGWASYICHSKLAEFDEADTRQALLDELEDDADHIGDRESFSIELTDKQWMNLSLSSDECPGRKSCPFGPTCKPQAARDRILTADVAVVNHSVLATDALVQDLSDGGFSLIGPADVVIVDEAHELEEFISGVMGEQFTEGSIRHLDGLFRTFCRKVDLGEMNDTAEVAADEMTAAGREFFDSLKPGRLLHRDVVENQDAFVRLLQAYSGLWQVLTSEEAREGTNRLPDMTDRNRVRAGRERMTKTVIKKIEALKMMLLQGDHELVRYVEEQTKTFRGRRETSKVLKSTPVSIAPWAREKLWPLYESAILISATILVDGSANYIASRLGLDNYTAMDAGTPFDYPKQAVLFVPTNLAEPSGANRNRWENMAPEMTLELVKTSGGGALLLFTSNKVLNQTWDAIAHRIPFECKRQGEESNQRLMSWFREETNGVLFATRSFFTGASFEGDTCRLVVIDKLPFPVPTEPVFEARCEEIVRRGGDSFGELTIPMMTLPLQQGFGRLIRTKRDRGVVAILDPRLKTKGYGAKIVRSLPPATMATDISAVERFFNTAAVV
jgi:ATP-dependent DNA helicase DinG